MLKDPINSLSGSGTRLGTADSQTEKYLEQVENDQDASLKIYWLGWWTKPEYGSYISKCPWWYHEERRNKDERLMCGSVRAHSEEEAMEHVKHGYHHYVPNLEFKFIVQKPKGWDPFCGRFPRSGWMKW